MKNTSANITPASRIDTQSGNEWVIKAQNLVKSFGNNHVLQGMNFHLYKGESLVVLGKSGTGKSVLIKCIVRLIEPDEGDLHVLEYDVPELHYDELQEMRRKVGFLFQGGALYDSMTVRENLEFPIIRQKISISEGEMNDLIEETLSHVGLKEAMDKMPSELSGGMKKRAALARTLVLKPQIILYDEPTTGLDPVTSKEISYLLKEMQEQYQISSIIITHDIPCAKITSDRIFIIDEGKFRVKGTFKDLKNSDEEWVRAFFK